MPRSALRALSLLLAGLAACGTPRSFVADPGPYDRVPGEWRAGLTRARTAFERGELATAHDLLEPLARERPNLVPVRVFLQEVELARLTREGTLGALEARDAEQARALLFERTRTAADAAPAAEEYVLAARLALDPPEALALLAEADTVDPRCVWVAYARAWWYCRARDFKAAREALRRALKADGGHLPSVRLSATLLAGAGDYAESAAALEVWLERTAEDPLYSSSERADALLDLAAVRVLLDDSDEALELLEALDPRALRDPLRAEAVRAAALAAADEPAAALEAVRRAAGLRPDALLPVVQEALLHQREQRVAEERAAWLRLLELTDGGEAQRDPAAIDFEAALFRLQAHARLARLADAHP